MEIRAAAQRFTAPSSISAIQSFSNRDTPTGRAIPQFLFQSLTDEPRGIMQSHWRSSFPNSAESCRHCLTEHKIMFGRPPKGIRITFEDAFAFCNIDSGG